MTLHDINTEIARLEALAVLADLSDNLSAVAALEAQCEALADQFWQGVLLLTREVG